MRLENDLRAAGHPVREVRYGRDVRIGIGVPREDLDAFRAWLAEVSAGTAVLEPVGDGYLDIWSAQRLTHRMKVYDKTDFSRLRELEIRIGGILLNDRSMPLVLILPQPTGTYLMMGWESVVEMDTSPFAPDRRKARVLREHLLPIEERTMVVPVV